MNNNVNKGKNTLKSAFGFLVFLFFINLTFSQNSYYVSTIGNDSNNGTSPITAWKTLSKVNTTNFASGDIINFKKGDVFYGTLEIRNKNGTSSNGIVFKSYGSGNQPIIKASRKVINWTQHNGNIWKSNVTKINDERTPLLFMNNVAQQIGREPNYNPINGGYRVINSHASNNTSVSETTSLPYASNRFQGGEITLRTTDDNVKIEKIVSHSGNTVNFSLSQPGNSFENNIEDNFGYFFQNHVNTLDIDGEWSHDTVNGILYLYSTTNPNNLNIEIPQENAALVVNNSKYVRIQDIRFESGLENTFSLNGSQDLTISGCYFYGGNKYSTVGYNLTNILFTNNTINDSNNLAVRWETISGITFSNNTVLNIGMRAGMGERSFIGYSGIRFYGKTGATLNLIENNLLDGIGYHGLQFGGENFTIRQNEIKNFCFTKDDGGGIYTVGNHGTNNSIYKNIVHDSQGAIRGVPQNRGVKTAGIYMDNDSKNQLVYENTVYNILGWGIMTNLSSQCTVRDNTVYNCEMSIVLSTYTNSFGSGGSVAQATNNTVLRNIFFTKTPTQLCARYTNQITSSGFNTFLGTLNNNYYCQPYNGGKEISIRAGNQTSEYLLPQFKSTYSNYETNGANAPIKYNSNIDPNSIIRLEVNKTGTPTTVNLGGVNYVDAKNIAYSGTVTIPPYSALVLLKANSLSFEGQITVDEFIKINLYPNPANEFITINGLEIGDKILITNIQGKTLVEKTANNIEEKVSIGTLQTGIYLAIIQGKAQIKFVVR